MAEAIKPLFGCLETVESCNEGTFFLRALCTIVNNSAQLFKMTQLTIN